MKKLVFFIYIPALFILSCTSQPVVTSGGKQLDQAITEASVQIEERVEARSKIALINFDSPSERFSSYVLDELQANLVNSRTFTVVERNEVDLIRNEFAFQFSGEVSDDSMQELGRMLGAQSIISGSLIEIDGTYRIAIRVLNVQTAVVEVHFRTDIANDSRVQALLGGRQPASAVRTSTEDFTYEVIGRSITITKYIGRETSVRIPESINGLPVTVIGDSAFLESQIISVEIPSSVTTIEHQGFKLCRQLRTVTIPSSVVVIEDAAFSHCFRLTDFTVAEQNKYFSVIEGVLFDKSGQTLESYPSGKSGVYNIPESVITVGPVAFGGATITGVTFPSTLETIRHWAFTDCERLNNVNIPSNVSYIAEYAFNNCRTLRNVTLSRRTAIGENTFGSNVRLQYAD